MCTNLHVQTGSRSDDEIPADDGTGANKLAHDVDAHDEREGRDVRLRALEDPSGLVTFVEVVYKVRLSICVYDTLF